MVPEGFVVYGLLLPATLVGLALAIGWWRATRPLLWLGPLGVALGWALGFRASNGSWPDFPPGRATEMLFYIGIAGGLMCASEGLRGERRGPVSALSRLPLAVVAPWLLLRNLVGRWEVSEAAWQLGGAALFLWGTWTAFEAVARRRAGFLAPLLLWLVVSAGAVAFVTTGSALYAQLSGTLAGLFGAALVVSLVRREMSLAHGTAGAVAIVFGCLCLGATHFSKLPTAAGVLLGLAPAAALLAGKLEGRLNAKRVLVRVVLVAVPVGVALYLAHQAAPPPNPYSGY